jgi:predicted ribosomally synthesized peptide with nif11-like leader
MAKQDFIRFYQEYLPQNPSLQSSINAIQNEEQFAKAVLDAGPKAGFKFTAEEVKEVMDASEKLVGKAELSEAQLDAVAGGAAQISQQTVQIQSLGSQTNILNRANLSPGALAGSTAMCCW